MLCFVLSYVLVPTLLKKLIFFSVFFFCLSFGFISPVYAQQFFGYPDDDPNSGRMTDVVRGYDSLGDIDDDQASLRLTIEQIATSNNQIIIQLFDGDIGGRWDFSDSGIFDSLIYEVYADPAADGSTNPSNLVASVNANTLSDNDWSTILDQANDVRALSPDGQSYIYNLTARWVNPVIANEVNNIKVRANAFVELPAGVTQGFIGYSKVENEFGTIFAADKPNTFDGTFTFKRFIPEPLTQDEIVCTIDIYDGDLDLLSDTDDANTTGLPPFSVATTTLTEQARPGDPADDSAIVDDPLRISPAVYIEIYYPDGKIQNLNVSGNREWELFRVGSNDPFCQANPPIDGIPADVTIPSIVSGEYFIVIRGADGRNTIYLTPLFGMEPAKLPPSSLGNYVWLDENGNGLQDAGERGLANVSVELTDLQGNVTTTQTDSNGNYLFTNLFPEQYSVSIDETTLPAGMTQSTNPVFSGADLGNQSQPYAITLGLGEQNLTADFGYEYGDPNGNSGTGAIGDYVWIDTNGDGVQDNGEAGLGGVEVSIYYDSDGDGQVNPGTDDVFSGAIDQNGTAGVGSTTTEVDGSYVFTNLPNGIYKIVVNEATLPSGYIQTGDPDEFGSTATNADNQTTNAIVIAPGDAFLNADFGYQPDTAPSNAIGDHVYFDVMGDGTFNRGVDLGLAGVTMSLVATATGESIAATVTDSNGFYLFDGLPDGDYSIEVTDTKGILSRLNQTADPDAVLDGMSSTSVAGGTSDLEQDFGYTNPGALGFTGLIGDRVFLDQNANNSFEAGEGIQGVTVELFSADGNRVLARTVTDENGFYSFNRLDPDASFVVKVLQSSLPGVGLTNSVDPDDGNDSESFIDLSADPDGVNDGVNLDQDFGYVVANPGIIGNLVWLDTNADGVNDGPAGSDGIPGNEDDEPGLEGVTLSLYVDSNSDGLLQPSEPRLAVSTTNINGGYFFKGLPAGDYIVDVTDSNQVVAGYFSSTGMPATNNNSQSDPYAINLVQGGADFTADFGYYNQLASVGDFIWFDSNFNGTQDVGEPGIAGVEVDLNIGYPSWCTNCVEYHYQCKWRVFFYKLAGR